MARREHLLEGFRHRCAPGQAQGEEKTSLVLYEAQSDVEVDAFMPHSHPGGECYVVLEGEVWDEDGTYPTGSIVWMDPESTHTPKTRGKTLILVLWPQGVKAACLRRFASNSGFGCRCSVVHVPAHHARQRRHTPEHDWHDGFRQKVPTGSPSISRPIAAANTNHTTMGPQRLQRDGLVLDLRA